MNKSIDMKRVLTTLLLVPLTCFLTIAQPAEIWVSPDGSDRNPGTREQPMASLTMSLRKAREMRRLNDPLIRDGIAIILKNGVYRLYEPVYIRPEDSGTESSPTLIRS